MRSKPAYAACIVPIRPKSRPAWSMPPSNASRLGKDELMLSEEDNVLLTRTGPSTPTGALFRRFWQPVALSRELNEPEGPPLRAKILGEDVRIFRSTDGTVGVVSPRC